MVADTGTLVYKVSYILLFQSLQTSLIHHEAYE